MYLLLTNCVIVLKFLIINIIFIINIINQKLLKTFLYIFSNIIGNRVSFHDNVTTKLMYFFNPKNFIIFNSPNSHIHNALKSAFSSNYISSVYIFIQILINSAFQRYSHALIYLTIFRRDCYT